MYIVPNTHQRRELETEISCQKIIEDLEVELNDGNVELQQSASSLTFWKSTFIVFEIMLSLVLAIDAWFCDLTTCFSSQGISRGLQPHQEVYLADVV